MKSRFFFIALLGFLVGTAVRAGERKIESPGDALAKAGANLTSNRVPAEFVDGGEAGEWSFWYIASGDTPETMRLKPLLPGKAVSPKTGKESFLLMPAVGADHVYTFPYMSIMKGAVCIDPAAPGSRKNVYGSGCAVVFKAKLTGPGKFFVEGRLRHAPDCRVTVFLKKKDGTCQILTSSEKPHADEKLTVEYGPADKRRKQDISRLRLQEECVMASDEMLIFAIDKVDQKHNRWEPVAYLTDPLKRVMKPLLSMATAEAEE